MIHVSTFYILRLRGIACAVCSSNKCSQSWCLQDHCMYLLLLYIVAWKKVRVLVMYVYEHHVLAWWKLPWHTGAHTHTHTHMLHIWQWSWLDLTWLETVFFLNLYPQNLIVGLITTEVFWKWFGFTAYPHEGHGRCWSLSHPQLVSSQLHGTHRQKNIHTHNHTSG